MLIKIGKYVAFSCSPWVLFIVVPHDSRCRSSPSVILVVVVVVVVVLVVLVVVAVSVVWILCRWRV